MKTHELAYIDGISYPITEGESILQFLKRHKGEHYIPTLCHAPNLSPGGSCRLCSVELVEPGHDQGRVVAACHTAIRPADHILPHSARMRRLRKNIVELIISDHPLDCLTCEANGNCQLQEVASKVGITQMRYPNGKNHLNLEKEVAHPYLTSDLSKCIHCNLCVKACDEVQGEFVLANYGRGFESRIIKGMDTTFSDSNCVSCGACVQACPTAAISDIFKSQAREATHQVRTVCTYCGVGCNLDIAVSGSQVLGIRAPLDAEVNQGHTCLKGRYAFQFYQHPDRLQQPLIRKAGTLVPATWEEAYDYIASKFESLIKEEGPDSIAGISSARCTNEENYLMQKFFRAVIGTNNIDGCARICHAPTAIGMQTAFGMGAATNSIADIAHTDCILLIGANPTAAHPVTGAKIKQAAIQGKTLIVIDPRKTDLARLATYHLALRPGTNVALLNMLLYFIIKEKLVDQSFIEARCEGYEALASQLLALDIAAMEAICGVDRALVKAAAIAYASAPAAMSFHGLGVTEHHQGTQGVMLVADLAMLTGNIGRPGTGVNPLRGQNNVQGAADMGVQPNQGPGYLKMADPLSRQFYEKVYGVSMPDLPGLTIPRMFDAALEGKLKALWIMGEDVVQTEPNTAKIEQALGQLECLVVQELFLSATAKFAHVVLPGASFLEKNGTFTNGERRIQRVNQAIPPLAGTKPDGQIIIDIMNKMGYPQADYHPEWILTEIAQVVPFFAGVKWATLGSNGKQWPVQINGTDSKILHQNSFKRGKGLLQFFNFKESPEIEQNSQQFPFILTTNRSLYHYNSGSMTRRTEDTLISGEDVLLIHPEDAAKKAIQDGEIISISAARGQTQIRAVISKMVKPGILSTTFHFPEVLINQITSEVLDTEADCPEYKVVAVDIHKLKRSR